MKPITEALLHSISLQGDPKLELQLAPELQAQLVPAGLGTLHRQAHFLAQACFETGYFRTLTENLSYRAERIAVVWPRLALRAGDLAHDPQALGNAAYALKNGNGDEASGDGYLFRGRGLFDLTGRGNYEAIGKLIGQDLVADPDLVAQPHIAVASALAFWNEYNINVAADQNSAELVTKLVNGAEMGYADRAILTHRAISLLTA